MCYKTNGVTKLQPAVGNLRPMAYTANEKLPTIKPDWQGTPVDLSDEPLRLLKEEAAKANIDDKIRVLMINDSAVIGP